MAGFNHIYRAGGVFYGWFEAMHSRFDLLIAGMDEEAACAAVEAVAAETRRLDKKLNRFDTSGETYGLNSLSYYTTFHTDDEMLDILEDAARYRALTGGLFDVCIQTPDYDPAEIYYTTDRPSKAVVLSRPGVIVDFGGYAKGLVLQKARDILWRHGVASAMMSFGGSSVCAIGAHPTGAAWQVGVENPFITKETAAIFSLDGGSEEVAEGRRGGSALSSSGNSPHNMGHIVSPITGETVQQLRVVSVSGRSPLDCEVLSTAIFAAGDDTVRREALLAALKGSEAAPSRVVAIDFSPMMEVEAVTELI